MLYILVNLLIFLGVTICAFWSGSSILDQNTSKSLAQLCKICWRTIYTNVPHSNVCSMMFTKFQGNMLVTQILIICWNVSLLSIRFSFSLTLTIFTSSNFHDKLKTRILMLHFFVISKTPAVINKRNFVKWMNRLLGTCFYWPRANLSFVFDVPVKIFDRF